MTPLELAITELQTITAEYVRAMAAETEARIAATARRGALEEAEAEAMLRADGRNAEQRDAQVQLDPQVGTARDLWQRADDAARSSLVAPIHDARRHFVSEVQHAVDPRRRSWVMDRFRKF